MAGNGEAILVLTGTAVLWINGRWPTGGFQYRNGHLRAPGREQQRCRWDSADQGMQIRGTRSGTMRLKTMWPGQLWKCGDGQQRANEPAGVGDGERRCQN